MCDEAAGAVVRPQTDGLQAEGDIAGPVGAVRLREGVACQTDISTDFYDIRNRGIGRN